MRLSLLLVCWSKVDERWRERSVGGMSRISTGGKGRRGEEETHAN